jgi:hypothetical protein
MIHQPRKSRRADGGTRIAPAASTGHNEPMIAPVQLAIR